MAASCYDQIFDLIDEGKAAGAAASIANKGILLTSAPTQDEFKKLILECNDVHTKNLFHIIIQHFIETDENPHPWVWDNPKMFLAALDAAYKFEDFELCDDLVQSDYGRKRCVDEIMARAMGNNWIFALSKNLMTVDNNKASFAIELIKNLVGIYKIEMPEYPAGRNTLHTLAITINPDNTQHTQCFKWVLQMLDELDLLDDYLNGTDIPGLTPKDLFLRKYPDYDDDDAVTLFTLQADKRKAKRKRSSSISDEGEMIPGPRPSSAKRQKVAAVVTEAAEKETKPQVSSAQPSFGSIGRTLSSSSASA